MDPDVFMAHWWLGFDEQAFDERWFKKEVTCHFDEDNRDCRNLASLLHMYAELESDKAKLKAFAYGIKDNLAYDEYLYLEVALFLFMYADDRSYYHLFADYDIEFYDSPYVPDTWNSENVLESLNSDDETKVVEIIKELIDLPFNNSMHSELFAPMVSLTVNEKFTDARYFANKYLTEMGFLVDEGDEQGGPEDMGRITITSGVIDLAEYLYAKPISNIWKYHAKNISGNLMNERNFSESQLAHFFEQLTYADDPEIKEKIAFIKKTKAYKSAKPSMKFMLAEHLMYEHEVHGIPILKQAYKQGNNAMKSALIAKYPQVFKADVKFWQKLMKKSSAAELILVERNKVQWDIKRENQT